MRQFKLVSCICFIVFSAIAGNGQLVPVGSYDQYAVAEYRKHHHLNFGPVIFDNDTVSESGVTLFHSDAPGSPWKSWNVPAHARVTLQADGQLFNTGSDWGIRVFFLKAGAAGVGRIYFVGKAARFIDKKHVVKASEVFVGLPQNDTVMKTPSNSRPAPASGTKQPPVAFTGISPEAAMDGMSKVILTLPRGVPAQDDGWSCGPNSATRVLKYYGINVTYPMVRTTAKNKMPASQDIAVLFTEEARFGTPPHVLRDTMRVWRNDTHVKRETELATIMGLLRQEKPVIALIKVSNLSKDVAVMGSHTIVGGLLDKINARPNITVSIPQLHWVIIYGFDQNTKTFYLHNTGGDRALETMTFDAFYAKWNWSIGEGVTKEALKSEAVLPRSIVY